MATEELLAFGCRRIVYLYSNRRRRRHTGRYLGYQQALWEHRIEPDPALVYTVGGEDYPTAGAVLDELKAKNITFDGIFANQTYVAAECFRWLRDNRDTLERTVKVLSFEDGNLAETYGGGITALKLNAPEISAKAVEMLAERMENRGKAPQLMLASYRLIRRNSTCEDSL